MSEPRLELTRCSVPAKRTLFSHPTRTTFRSLLGRSASYFCTAPTVLPWAYKALGRNMCFPCLCLSTLCATCCQCSQHSQSPVLQVLWLDATISANTATKSALHAWFPCGAFVCVRVCAFVRRISSAGSSAFLLPSSVELRRRMLTAM